ncbi:MAG: endonuclease domain-containing protein [Flavobacteriales bacterium]|nr:endonuclease domain-containing protein [Flavobacteriales bacterium]
MSNKIIPYKSYLKPLARKLRKEMTLSEIILWQEIRKKNLEVQFHRQVPIDNYIVDFYCHELKLAIEVDGSSHNLDEALEKDIIRQNKLKQLGISFIRFDNLEVKNDMYNILKELEGKINELKDTSIIPSRG